MNEKMIIDEVEEDSYCCSHRSTYTGDMSDTDGDTQELCFCHCHIVAVAGEREKTVRTAVYRRYQPPVVYEKLVEQFGVSFEDGTCITYGDGIHLHHSQKLSDHLLEHEKVHVIQQHQYGVEAWWVRYLSDPEFRKQQEGEAYRKQWQYIKSTRKDRNAAFRLKIQILKHLSSPMYGNCCSMQDAEKIIGK